MRFEHLADWLSWQESLHIKSIDLGLERVQQVAGKLFSRKQFPLIITVAGTNGKGSVCAFLSSIFSNAGYRCGLYSSPHLLRYNERIRIGGDEVDDQTICSAFDRVDTARGEISLTYFEFGTLAALDIFSRSALDVVILEVGLGGRLDAVNILDPDVAVISSIDLDHQDWLGNDRESIALEKLGISRAGVPLVLGELDLPSNVIPYCEEHNIPVFQIRREFAFTRHGDNWQWQGPENSFNALPRPGLNGTHQLINASTALMAATLVNKRLPLGIADIRMGLLDVSLGGRLEHRLFGDRTIILDVAHNPQAGRVLAESLSVLPEGQYYGLVGMLEDKAIEQTLEPLKNKISQWMLIDLPPPRGASNAHLDRALENMGVAKSKRQVCSDISHAIEQFLSLSRSSDKLVIFGSFITVSEALQFLAE